MASLQASVVWQDLLKQQLKPFLDIAEWGIGGSCLLQHAALVTAHRDIDIVCSPAAFQQLQHRCVELGFLALPVTPHPQMQSDHFARWRLADGVEVELMAGIKVVRAGVERRWCFSPCALRYEHGLPWMQLNDWFTLYQLFERPARVQQILHGQRLDT